MLSVGLKHGRRHGCYLLLVGSAVLLHNPANRFTLWLRPWTKECFCTDSTDLKHCFQTLYVGPNNVIALTPGILFVNTAFNATHRNTWD